MWEIRKEGEKYYKKFKPCGAELLGVIVTTLAILYLIFQLLRG
jgi:hypothetical protein